MSQTNNYDVSLSDAVELISFSLIIWKSFPFPHLFPQDLPCAAPDWLRSYVET